MTDEHSIRSTTIFGSSLSAPTSQNYKDAYATAKLIAQSGRTVINGGGPGTMLAATTGAKDGGGKAVAVYYTPHYATSFEGKAAENFADQVYEEANYLMRTKKLIELGDLYIIFNGGTGTISEFGMAWGLARLYFGHHKPLILFGKRWKHIVDSFKKNMLIPEEALRVIKIVETPEEVVDMIDEFELILKINRHTHDCVGDECRLML